MAAVIARYGVNFPYMDQLGIAQVLIKAGDGTLSLADLMVQHNESRFFFTRLIFLGLGNLTSWNVKYEMYVMLLLASLTSYNIYRISRATVAANRTSLLWLLFVANLLVFAPIQYENWLFGMQVVMFMPITCLTTCIVVAYSRLAMPTKFTIGIILSIISTYSYANGMLLWVVALPVLAWSDSWQQLKQKKWLILAWIICFAASTILYFHDYQRMPNHPPMTDAFRTPLKTAAYYLSFFGSPFALNRIFIAVVIGSVMLALLGLAIAIFSYRLWMQRDTELCGKLIGWLMIAVYAAISGLATALGRVGFGISQSLSSRYTTFSLYLYVGLFYFATVLLTQTCVAEKISWRDARLRAGVTCLALAGVLLYTAMCILALEQARAGCRWREEAKACTLFINFEFVQNWQHWSSVYPELAPIKRTYLDLNRLGLLQPGLMSSLNLREAATVRESPMISYGRFASLTTNDNQHYEARGIAVTPSGDFVNAVVLTYQNRTFSPTVFAFAGVGMNYRVPERQTLLQRLRRLISGVGRRVQMNGVAHTVTSDMVWQTTFSADDLPPGNLVIKAWAVDPNTKTFTELDATHELQR